IPLPPDEFVDRLALEQLPRQRLARNGFDEALADPPADQLAGPHGLESGTVAAIDMEPLEPVDEHVPGDSLGGAEESDQRSVAVVRIRREAAVVWVGHGNENLALADLVQAVAAYHDSHHTTSIGASNWIWLISSTGTAHTGTGH